MFEKHNEDRKFTNNTIRTTKYTCLTFLPLNLFHQFTKMANCYFLILTLLCLIPGISTQGEAITMLMPLMFVVGVSMIKDIFEDRRRYKSDCEENTRDVMCIPKGES